jgi:hypothetical protein
MTTRKQGQLQKQKRQQGQMQQQGKWNPKYKCNSNSRSLGDDNKKGKGNCKNNVGTSSIRLRSVRMVGWLREPAAGAHLLRLWPD